MTIFLPRCVPLFVLFAAVCACGNARRANAIPFSTFENPVLFIGKPDVVPTINNNENTQSTIAHAADVAYSSRGVLAVAQRTGRVVLFNTFPIVNSTPADVVVGQLDFAAPGFTVTDTEHGQVQTHGCTASITGDCYGVAFSSDGNKLIVADTHNNRVLIWNSIPTHNGQKADVVVGQVDFLSHDSSTTDRGFDMPVGVMTTPTGKLLITDYRNGRVLVYNSIPTSNGVAADVVIGQNDFTSGNEYMGFTPGIGANQLRSPFHTALTADEKLLVVSSGNSSVRIWNSIPTSNGAPADVIIGQPDFSTGNSGLHGRSANTLSEPTGVAVSPTGQLAISDSRNRVLVYNRVPTRNGSSADVVLGQPDFTSNNHSSGLYGVTFLPDGRLVASAYHVLVFGTPAPPNTP